MKQPQFWFLEHSIRSKLLAPLALIWQTQTRKRVKRLGHKLSIPVICVGNINLGGTGKTPTAIYLIENLTAKGLKPYLVMLGYKGSHIEATLVTDAHTAKEVGDEAILMSSFAPVIVSKNRAEGGKLAQKLGADIVVMDDGFQNPSLAKDYSIVVVDSDIGFGNGLVCPSGPLRETLDDAKKRADAYLLIGEGRKRDELLNQIGHGSVIVEADLAPIEMGMNWQDKPVVAFAGIGRPEKFFNTLKGLGVDMVASHEFDDHQEISLTIMQRMEKEAWEKQAQLVTTEKDAARLPSYWQGLVLSLPVRLRIKNGDLLSDILKKIALK